MFARLATPADAAAVARIHNEGIAERIATFETRPRTEDDVRASFDGVHPVVVVEDDGAVLAFASSALYRPRECYAGVAEFAVYVARVARRRGAGKLALERLMEEARGAGFWKLVSRVFVENAASRALCRGAGFREVGTYIRHAKLDGEWRDVVVIEKFLAPVSPRHVEPGAGAHAPRAGRDAILEGLRAGSREGIGAAIVALRAFLERGAFADPELVDAAIVAFASTPAHAPATREHFVQLIQTLATSTPEAPCGVWRRLLATLDSAAARADLARFYEVLLVVKQAIKLSAGRLHARDLAPELPRLVAWLKEAIALPATAQGRISVGNVATLLMSVAEMAAESEEQKREIVALVPEAMARHHVAPPASFRPATLRPISSAPAAARSVPPPLPARAMKTAPPEATSPPKGKSERARRPKKKRAKT